MLTIQGERKIQSPSWMKSVKRSSSEDAMVLRKANIGFHSFINYLKNFQDPFNWKIRILKVRDLMKMIYKSYMRYKYILMKCNKKCVRNMSLLLNNSYSLKKNAKKILISRNESYSFSRLLIPIMMDCSILTKLIIKNYWNVFQIQLRHHW